MLTRRPGEARSNLAVRPVWTRRGVLVFFALTFFSASRPNSSAAQSCQPCQADCDRNGRIEVNELVTAVNEALAGCANDPFAAGRVLYEAPHQDGNTFACATCHALAEPTRDGLVRPGHPLAGAPQRPTWKDGQLIDFRDAVNTCRRDWLAAPDFGADDPRFMALLEFLAAQSEAQAVDPLVYAIVDPPADTGGGDPLVGQRTFNGRCIVCHGENGTGTERAPAITGTKLSPDFIALKVRRSGNPDSDVYPGLTPGRMPFWSADRISDRQIRDIIAFLQTSEPPDTMENDDRVDLSLAGARTDCGSSDPRVGRALTFRTVAHRVAGTATIIDNCTIRLDGFTYDGGGINVRVYGGRGGNYGSGIPLSRNMVGQSFSNGQATIRLPAGVDLEQFDGLSIWCVAVGFSFGDGLFEANRG